MMQKIGITFGIAFAFIFQTHCAQAQWVEANGPYQGPYDGHSYAFATFGSIVFAGTDSGVYRSLDSGHSWAAYGSAIKDSAVYELTVAGSFIFAQAGSAAFRSVDTGRTWQPTRFFVTAVSGQHWFASGDSGIYHSSDNGISWIVVNRINSHLFAAGDNVVYAGCDSELCIRTTNFGTTWDTILTGGRNGSIEVLRAKGNTVCIGTSGDYHNSQRQYPAGYSYISVNKGNTWFIRSYGNVWDFPIDFVINPPSIVAGWSNSGIIQSIDDTTWTPISQNLPPIYWGGPFLGLSEIGSTIIAAFNGYHIYGLNNTDTMWQIYTSPGSDIPESDRYIKSLASDGNNLAAISIYGNVYRTLDSGEHWMYLATLPINGDSGYTSLTFNDGKLFAGTDSGVAVSSDFGTNWKFVPTKGSSIMPIMIDGNRMIAGGQGIYVSTDVGSTWTPQLGRPPGDVRSIAVLGQRLFVTTEFGLFKSDDNGTHWDQINVQVGKYPARIHSVFVSNSNLLLAGDQIYLSTDAGTTWTAPDMGLGNSRFDDVALYAKINSVTFAALYSNGLDYSYNNGVTWQNDTTSIDLFVSAFATNSQYLYVGMQNSYPEEGVYRHPISNYIFSSVMQQQQVESDLSFSPNPTTGIIAIHNAPANILHVTITNVLGETVSEIINPLTSDFTIDLSKFSPGTYFARFTTAGDVITRKIIKE